MATDFYELLEVDKSASDDEIKRSYRRLARAHHPDANQGDLESEAKFKEITVAYETLRDPERRRRYDMFGPDAERGAGRGFDGFGGNFGDIFETFFGQSGFGGRGQGQRTDDAEVVADLTFEQAVFGAEIGVQLNLATPCPTCDGSGARPGTTPVSCPDCHGAGEVRRVRQSLLGQMVTAMPCARCHGTGEHVTSPCATCRGEGRVLEGRQISVQVPPGVDNGATLRVAGQGPAGVRSRGPGDLYVHLRVAPHDRFERSHNDLLVTLHIQITHAALGAEVELETLEGPQVLTIAAGTQSGKVMRVRGRGVPDVHRGKRGDLLIRLVVDTPTRLSKTEEDLLKQFAASRGDDVSRPESGLFSRIKSTLS